MLLIFMSVVLRLGLRQGIWVWPTIRFRICLRCPSLLGDLGVRSTKESSLAQKHSTGLYRGI